MFQTVHEEVEERGFAGALVSNDRHHGDRGGERFEDLEPEIRRTCCLESPRVVWESFFRRRVLFKCSTFTLGATRGYV